LEMQKNIEELTDGELVNLLNEQKHIANVAETRQMVIKVILNSLYGCLGNKYFRWFQVEHAEAITWSGQLVIQWVAKRMNEYLNDILKTKDKDYVIASDTDSLYLALDGLVQSVFPLGAETHKIVKFLDKASATKITDVLNKSYDNLAEYMNAFENKMSMKRETISEKGIWTGKKKYILSVWSKEKVYYDKAKTKITGIESVRSTTPAACKKAIKDAIDLMIHGTESELISHVSSFKKEYMKLPIMDIAIPSGISDVEEYSNDISIYASGTPQHVKGALLYNFMRQQKNITEYPPVYAGDKIKMFLLSMPNPCKDNVISVPNYLPDELGLKKYIDKEGMFERSFMGPVMKISNVIGWKSKRENTLF
jgi:DNA polymerase elongation subunit (family B)